MGSNGAIFSFASWLAYTKIHIHVFTRKFTIISLTKIFLKQLKFLCKYTLWNEVVKLRKSYHKYKYQLLPINFIAKWLKGSTPTVLKTAAYKKSFKRKH